ncbi:MAG: carbohydrate kinase family protein [Thaumarchaeota archaeon]|nr:carbohydrate kinase family protein [Nitrososphaerota archaeon]
MPETDRILKIKSALSNVGTVGNISVMPDYFVDRLIKIDSFDSLVESIKKKSSEGGGGSIRGIPQIEIKGGNAVNLGYALSRLGASVNVIAIAGSHYAHSLRSTFGSLSNTRLYMVDGKPGLTTAFEFLDGGRRVNVMVSDVGDLRNFDGSLLVEEHWQALAGSKVACVVNWSANVKGNDLCEKVFTFAKQRGLTTFFDPADVSGQIELVPEFKKRILDKRLVDVFSLNENEIRLLCKKLGNYSLAQDYSPEDLEHAALVLSDISGSRVDLHTREFSVTCSDHDVTRLACYKVVQKTVTGAGDVWDSADICGHLCGLSDEDRLHVANAAGGLYVSDESAKSPDVNHVLRFMETHKATGARS